MSNHTLEDAILNFVAQSGYRPMKPRAIAQRLHLSKDQADDLKRAVKRLVREGKLAYGANHLVRAGGAALGGTGVSPVLRESTGKMPVPPGAAMSKSRVLGVFHRTQKGFGFVRPQAPSPTAGAPNSHATRKPAAKKPGIAAARAPAGVQDIYIPRKYTGDAASGDLVLVQLQRGGGPRSSRGAAPAPKDHLPLGPRGTIVEVVDRQTRRFVGLYLESAGSGYVQVDGTLFAQPICVGDPGAKGARADDKVVFEMVRFPSPAQDGEGVIVEVLGPRGKPGVDTLSILREFNLPESFEEDVLEEARREAEKFDESIPPARLDLTELTIVTIDPVDARDFDDAISLQRLDGGNWRLGVHIADVTHFVRPRSALDREARARATSVYLPDRVIPMLPEVISNSLASLQPGKVRYTKTAFLEFTAEGLLVAAEFHSAAIRSSKRLTYEQVDAFLAEPDAWRRKLGAKVHSLLGDMHSLAMTLRQRRMKNGCLELSLPEVKVDLDDAGRVVGARVVENTESHQVIEEFMLAANEAVARMLFERGLPFLRRIHPSPSEAKIRALAEFIRELGLPAANLQSRFELQKLLAAVAGRPEHRAVHFAVLRSLQRAVYAPEEEGHYALASDCYCHFTSPIRRYPDLTVHRLLGETLAGRTPRTHLDDLVVLGQHCSDCEQRAEAAERDLLKLKLLTYLSGRIGEEMDGVVTGVESMGLFVEGLELPAQGLIHADALSDDYYDFDRATHSLTGRRGGKTYRLGDVVRVAVARVDLERRELDFRLVARKPAARKGKEAKAVRRR